MSGNGSLSSDLVFLVLLLCTTAVLYVNSLNGAFIWDDRAAVVKNNDVHGITPFSSLFLHDFWGTDITRSDSHKSYRPVTVATFRVDYSNYALDAHGYHITNVLIYALTCICVYAVIGQWLSPRGSRVATLLFAFHPLHVEAVSSIVGRADALCGLFYCAALYSYTLGVRLSAINPRAVLTSTALVMGFLFAGLATLSKEIGFTVLGVFVVVELAEQLKQTVKRSSSYKEIVVCEHGAQYRTAVLTKHSLEQSVQLLASAMYQCVHNGAFIARMFVIVGIAAVYFKFRAKLHGEHMLYKWTMMENHVLYLPTLYERSLSYAQYHYQYIYKLIDPAELCFDYGYACIPTVHTVFDVANLRPFFAYSVVLSLLIRAVYFLRVNVLMGIALLLVPLVPALNVLVPVGTLLAERLLFIPSIGFCMVVGEVVSVDLEQEVERLLSRLLRADPKAREEEGRDVAPVNTSPPSLEYKKTKAVRFESGSPTKKRKGSGIAEAHKPRTTTTAANSKPLSEPTTFAPSRCTKLMYLLLLPILYRWGERVVSRNKDWQDEYSLYKSGLAVCPRSLKVLTNFAVLAMARGEYDHALEVALRATDIYPEQVAALINAGVAYQKLHRFAESVDQFKRCLSVDPNQGKAAGYLGVSYYHWASAQTEDAAREVLREEALKYLLQAIERGFQAPAILHFAGSALLDAGRTEDSIAYYEAALRQSANYASYYGAARSVPILLEDDIQPVATLNQLGSAYRALQRFDEAVEAYKRGLQIDPHDLSMLTNLGNLYREMGETDQARGLMLGAITRANEQAPPALLNNLGLLELNEGHCSVALDLFQRALRSLRSEVAEGYSLSSGSGGSGAEETIIINVGKARDCLTKRI